MIITCLLCGHQEEHESRGLCDGCYQKARRMGMLAKFPLRKLGRPRRRPVCWEPQRKAA